MKKIQANPEISIKQEFFRLIDGVFTPHEASSVLLNLVNSKINYHELQAFGMQIRNEGDLLHSLKRIEDLKKVFSSIETMIEDASEKGLKLQVKGNIEITVVE